jgi:phosphoenolpyruvate-protein phosphotransferase (PTS system enzyme I)
MRATDAIKGKSARERILRGLPVSPGIVLGSVFVYGDGDVEVPERDIRPDKVDAEVERFLQAVKETRDELTALAGKILAQAGKDFAEFVDVLLLLLDERDAIDGTTELIRTRCKNAEFAYAEVTRRLTAPLIASHVAFVQEKLADTQDVRNRVLRHLLSLSVPSLLDAPKGAVIVARDLPPSEATLLDRTKIAGVAAEIGGKTSHTALMTKAKEIPMVAGIEHLLAKVVSGESVILDGYRGILVLAPTQKRLSFYKQEQARLATRQTRLFRQSEQEPVTTDGRHLDILANVEFVADCEYARRNGARGIGLFRSEYLIIARRRLPTEDEQYEVYAELARRMNPYPVVIRTFDMGGDKVLPGYSEANPFLGWRAIRFCIDNRDFFKTHLRAILRASARGNVRIMLPMIATVEELRRSRLILNEAKAELRARGQAFDEQVPLGIMVEIPSAAIMAPSLARSCDFFSIGSNDLTQYTLAVDRGNERVAKLYDHFHPSVLRLMKMTVDSAHESEIEVGLCGEFASDPLGIVLLVGLGVDQLSMVPGLVPQAIGVVRACDRAIARELTEQALKYDTSLEVTRFLHRAIDQRLPALSELIYQTGNHESRAPNGEKESGA